MIPADLSATLKAAFPILPSSMDREFADKINKSNSAHGGNNAR